jgi:hypothetical protein
VGDATSLPSAFDGRADEVTLTLPWGSLLRPILIGDERFAAGIAAALRPGGRLRVVTSLEDRDRSAVAAPDADPGLGAFAITLEAVGLGIVERRDVTTADMAVIRSSWARRLGIPARRPARLLVARKPGPRSAAAVPQPPSASATVVATSRMSDS